MPSRSGGWIFPVGTTPRIIWRDVDDVRRLGREVTFRVRWFNSDLDEFPEPNASGRWLAWIEGQAPNGTVFRRSLTFFALPQKIEPGFDLNLSVELTKFPGPNAPLAWSEHKAEFDRVAQEFLTRSLIDSEMGAILIAGIAESKPLGRPKRFTESTSVANDTVQLALKLKMLGLQNNVQMLKPYRTRPTSATELRQGPPDEAGVPADAKSKIDEFCRAWALATGEPFVTMVAQRGVIVTHEAFGNDPSGGPLDRDYRCWVASITKTVTALMFSQFVDQQLIDFDAPISTVFPDFPDNDSHVPTFRQCLNHTAGLSGHGDFGGMRNPHLENVILNAIDANEPGKEHVYSGMGFELAAKAMEMVAGKAAARIYDEHLFRPLGFGDVVMRNASSDGEFTAMELGILAQWVANQGSYGDMEFITPETFNELLPRPLHMAGATDDQGLGLHRVRHRKPHAAKDSMLAEDHLFGPRTIGHGSFSGCIFVIDPDTQLVITQVRQRFGPADEDWYARFFETIAEAVNPQ
jgi:CubicO group peptidase (beta-lactamase class C family)